MPLPTTSLAWPPVELAQITPIVGAWSAWWTGQPNALRKTYTIGRSTIVDRPSQYQGGVAGRFARFWWGRPTGDLTQVHDQTHVPLAADMARTSADLLFADPPTFTVDDKATQDRIDETVGDRMYATLAGAAESGAALGGTYLRVAWDREVNEAAFLTVVNADVAWPEFSWGRLRAVTFWHVVQDNGNMVLRHLERHELENGIGLIQHGLYSGTPDRLGRPIPLEEHSSTKGLAGAVDEFGYITSGRTPGLNVVYIPNCDPSVAKAFMGLPAAAGWGGSDLDGVEPMLDNLDEIYSSWMRDIRLGKARVLLARYMLDDLGVGMGAGFNMDQELFIPLKMAAAESGDAPITDIQFKIRYAEHQASAQEWTEKIIRSAGYSLATFGENPEGVAITATEVTAKSNRSLSTRDAKIRAWRPALGDIMGKLLEVDADVFGRTVNVDGMEVDFSDGSQDSPLVLAQTAQALSVAQAASTQTLVALVHPSWDDTKVKEEVARIAGEQPEPAADPFTIGAMTPYNEGSKAGPPGAETPNGP